MNEEEKQAIEYLKVRLYGNEGCYLIDVAQSDLRIFLNLVEKQQKEIEKRLKEIDSLYKMMSAKDERIENLIEYINSPEFLDWNLGFKLIDELEYRKDRINEILGE